MKAHAALPDRKNLQRVAQVVSRLVKQAVAHTPAQHHAHDAHEQNVFDIFARPGARAGHGGIRLMAQPPKTQKHEKAESGQVSQTVPMDSQGPQLQGNRVNLGVNQHARHCARKPGALSAL